MLSHWCWYSQYETDRIMEIALDGIHRAEFSQLPAWFRLVHTLLEITDCYREHRAHTAAKSILRTAKKFKSYPKFTRAIVTQWIELYRRDEIVRQWCDDNRESWRWLESWMRANNMRLLPPPAASTLPPPPTAWSTARTTTKPAAARAMMMGRATAQEQQQDDDSTATAAAEVQPSDDDAVHEEAEQSAAVNDAQD
jgi:hypothetical protein